MSEPVELLPPGTGPHDERWHELRRAGVTASEIAVVMGISPYESPFSLFWQKVNDWRWGGNEYTGVGSHLEDAIADWWMAECDPIENLQMAPAGLYAHPDRPWQLATPDRLLFASQCVCFAEGDVLCSCLPGDGPLLALLECKWVAQSWDGWGEQGTDEVPVYYRAQALWQLDTLGVDEVHIAVLGPTGFRAYLVRRDEDDLTVMRAAGAAFMRQLEDGEAPDLDGHSATISALQRLHPSLGEGDVEVPVELAERYRLARADRDEAKDRVAVCEAQIRAALGSDFNRAVVGKKLVASRSIFERTADDTDELHALDDGFPITDRLNPGRATSYA
jgi:putative phage-type endonuclease